MKVTIIPEDRLVLVDGITKQFDYEIDPNVHAIQWHGDYGFIEQKEGGQIKINDFSSYQDIADKHAALVLEDAALIDAQVIEDAKPLNIWLSQMQATDVNMPRYIEDIMDALSTTVRDKIAPETLDNYNAKKALRAEKPA